MDIPENLNNLYDVQSRVCSSIEASKDCENIQCENCIMHHDHIEEFSQFIDTRSK